MLIRGIVAVLVQAVMDGYVLVINPMVTGTGLLRLLSSALGATCPWVLACWRLRHILLLSK